jgi:hypothetical protein
MRTPKPHLPRWVLVVSPESLDETPEWTDVFALQTPIDNDKLNYAMCDQLLSDF